MNFNGANCTPIKSLNKPAYGESRPFIHIHFVVTVGGVTITVEGDVHYSIWTHNWTFDGCVDVHGGGLNIHQCDIHTGGHAGTSRGIIDWGTGNRDAESLLNTEDFMTQWEDYIAKNACDDCLK